ncbi:hypothetical protein R1flu_014710 [Riccia fluitans]|uniref:Uncharacterized protein n=1 Tax=Riccia fluitans TaxID=41844 RepID=A0ABD1YK79_9MARC
MLGAVEHTEILRSLIAPVNDNEATILDVVMATVIVQLCMLQLAKIPCAFDATLSSTIDFWCRRWLRAQENLLESLRLEVNEPSWTGDPCGANISWIDCSDDFQHLTALKLHNMNLSGPIPSEVAKFKDLKILAI